MMQAFDVYVAALPCYECIMTKNGFVVLAGLKI